MRQYTFPEIIGQVHLVRGSEFEDIKHIVGNRTGIFVSERRPESLLENIKFISQNNETIFNDMEKNNLPTKDNFIKQMVKIIN